MNFLFQHNSFHYTINDFIFRLKKLQKIVDKEEIDGLLVINGVDSEHNSESTKLMNWLFLGKNGVEIEQNEYMDENFNEMVLLIKKKGVISIYLEPPLYEILKCYLIIMPNIEIFCPNDQQYDNKDDMELIKITQFIKMVRDLKTIGVLLENKYDSNVNNNVEKWPLIQAYGQGDLGYGFFTLDHKVVSLTKRINAVYKNHDKFSLENLFSSVSSRLSNHINSAFLQITGTKFNKRVAITEEQLIDILKDSYEIGEMGKFLRGSTNKILPKPRILFGINTGKPFELGSGPDTFISASNNKPNSAIHATVEYMDIVSKLRVGRTYFLTKNVSNDVSIEKILDDMDDLINYKLSAKENQFFHDEEILINLYIALIISCYESFHGFSQNYKLLTTEFIEQNILKTVGKVYAAYHENSSFNSKNINITLNCYNSFGEEVKIDFKDSISFKLTPYIYILRAQINEIESPITGKLLGSLLFCESFLIQEGCFLLLTRDTSYFNLWNINSEVTDQIQNMRITIATNDLGKCLTKDVICENCRVFFPQEKLANYNIELPILPSKLILYEKGLKIFNEQIGWIILLFKNSSEVDVVQKLEKPWVIFKINENLIGESLKCNRICIELTGNALLSIFFKLKELMISNTIKYEELNEIPSFFFTSNSIRTESKIFPQNYLQPLTNMNKSQILNHKLLFSYLESKQLVILNKLSDLKLSTYKPLYEEHLVSSSQSQVIIPETGQIQIIIVNGGNCSGKQKFAENLIRYENEFSPIKFHILSFKRYEFPFLDENKVLRRLIDLAVERKIACKNNIIILVQPTKLNVQVLIDLLEKNQDLAGKFRIKCVITKVNINNMFENLTMQFSKKVLCFGVEGYSQFLFLDSYGNPENQIDQWNKTIRMALPNAVIYRITNNIVQMGIIQDIMKYEGFYLEKNKFERLRNKVFCDFFEQNQQNSFIFIPFHIPIVKEKLNNYVFKEIMRKNEGFLYKRKEISQEEKEKAEKSRDSLAIELLKLKGMLIDLDKKLSKKTPHLIYIKAIVRFQKCLEEGLYEITITSNYYIERLLKNVKTQVIKEKINEKFEIEKAIYENFDDLKMIGFLFHGENLNEEKLMELLGEISQAKIKEKKKLLRRTDLSEEVIKKIEFDNRGHGLEDGDFYDGTSFRDNCGNIIKSHPKLDVFIEEYLKEKNIEIKKENEEMEKEAILIQESFKLF